MPENDVPRRTFLRGVTAATALSYSRVYGANERVQLGLIGAGERGRGDMGNFVKIRTPWMSPPSATSTPPQIDAAPSRSRPRRRRFTRPPQAARDEGTGRRADRACRTTGTRDRHRCAERRQGRLRGEAADAARSRKARRSSRRRASTTASARSACSSAPGKHYLRGQSASTSTPASWARSRWRARGGTATATICARRRRRWQQQPSNLDWAHFLGPLKWRDWDPQQYWNWRAYLDFGGGQVTDLFTHWIDVVHMFMGPDIPIAAVGGGRRLPLQGRPHGAGHDQRAAGIPAAIHGDVRSDAGARHHRRGDRILRHARAGCGSTAAATNSRRWAATRSRPW